MFFNGVGSMDLIYSYLVFGLGFYVGLALNNLESFSRADTLSIIRGFLVGCIFWPIGIILKAYWYYIMIIESKKGMNKHEI